MAQNQDQSKAADDAELKDFKEKFIAAATLIDKFKEPLEELFQLFESLQDAVESGKATTKEDWTRFMNEDLAPGISKRLTKKSPLNDKVSPIHLLANLMFYSMLMLPPVA